MVSSKELYDLLYTEHIGSVRVTDKDFEPECLWKHSRAFSVAEWNAFLSQLSCEFHSIHKNPDQPLDRHYFGEALNFFWYCWSNVIHWRCENAMARQNHLALAEALLNHLTDAHKEYNILVRTQSPYILRLLLSRGATWKPRNEWDPLSHWLFRDRMDMVVVLFECGDTPTRYLDGGKRTIFQKLEDARDNYARESVDYWLAVCKNELPRTRQRVCVHLSEWFSPDISKTVASLFC